MKKNFKYYDIDFADIEKGLYKLVVGDDSLHIITTGLKLPIIPDVNGKVCLSQDSSHCKKYSIQEIYEWVVCIKDNLCKFYDLKNPDRIVQNKYKINEDGQIIYSPKHLQKYGVYIFYKSIYGNSVQLLDSYGDKFKVNVKCLMYKNVPKYIDMLKNDFVMLKYENVKDDTYMVNAKGDVFSLNNYSIIKYANEATRSYSLQTKEGKCKSITRTRARAIYELIANNRDVWCQIRRRNIRQKYSETYVRNICKLLEIHNGDFKAVLAKEFGIIRQRDDASLSRLVRSLANRKIWSRITKDYNY